MPQRLLLVEDDPALARGLSDLLRNDGYDLELAMDGPSALETAKSQTFDLIILDVALPGLSGFQVCRTLRESGVDAPILMLTARDRVDDKIAGLKSGADDYLTKPFDVGELRARLEALTRRSLRAAQPAELVFRDARVDLANGSVVHNGRATSLSEREMRLLRYFIENRGQVISRDTLLEHVWGYASAPFTRTVDVHILRLRQKIEVDPKNPKLIVTVHGLGYRFDG